MSNDPTPPAPTEQPNIRAEFYGGHWDGNTAFFSGAYSTYSPIVPINDESGNFSHRERSNYRLDTSRNHLPLIYRWIGSERVDDKQGNV